MNVYEAYLIMQDASGIGVGDTVKVLRGAESCAMGWDNTWDMNMDKRIDREAVVTSINGNRGVSLRGPYSYPFFVLDIVKKAEEHHTISIDGKEPIGLSLESFKALQRQFTEDK